MTEKNGCGRSEIFYKAYSLAYFKGFKINFTQKQPARLSSHLPQQHCAVHSYANVWGAGLHSALICQAVGFLGVGGGSSWFLKSLGLARGTGSQFLVLTFENPPDTPPCPTYAQSVFVSR